MARAFAHSKAQPSGFWATTQLTRLALSGTSIRRKHLDILPSPKGRRDSSRHREGFLFQRVLPEGAFALPGLTASPQADTASPAANTFLAALISRSWKV